MVIACGRAGVVLAELLVDGQGLAECCLRLRVLAQVVEIGPQAVIGFERWRGVLRPGPFWRMARALRKSFFCLGMFALRGEVVRDVIVAQGRLGVLFARLPFARWPGPFGSLPLPRGS